MDITQLRGRINEINDEILKLFCERMEVSELIAEYKRENDLPITDSAREQEIFRHVASEAGELGEYAVRLFELLISLSKEYQNELLKRGER